VLSTNGDTYLGGDDLDRAIIEYWMGLMNLNASEDQKTLKQQLRLAAEAAKIALSNATHFETNFAGEKLIITKEKSASTIGKTILKVATVRAPTFLTTATSGTLFLFEIIRALPTRIFLYGFNFYTSKQLYSKALLDSYKTTNALKEIGLPKNWFDLSSHQKSSANICAGFIAHDPKSDFLLIKNLYELSGLIDGTPEVMALLNLTADEYDLKLEEMLGDW
jgi:hypothetical protein